MSAKRSQSSKLKSGVPQDTGADVSDWLKCPRCASRNMMFRTRAKDYQCRKCGAVFEADWKKRVTQLIT